MPTRFAHLPLDGTVNVVYSGPLRRDRDEDDSVGVRLDRLDEAGALDRTLTFFIGLPFVARTVILIRAVEPTVIVLFEIVMLAHVAGGLNGPLIVVSADAVLLFVVVSACCPTTTTVFRAFVAPVALFAFTTIVTVTLAPAFIVPIWHVTTGLATVHEPCVELADTALTKSIGSVSVATTPVAVLGPALVTTIV